MARIEIMSGTERRRRWSEEAKLRILAEADEPGARIGDVARGTTFIRTRSACGGNHSAMPVGQRSSSRWKSPRRLA
ncbi:transposase [Neorhizobium turbinariae]|uniref:transposase n=1 Tax=Neorhizobium turbinariae TaxID=2937795 RepID=UPI0036F2137D